MPELRTAREDELPEMRAFARDYAGSDTSLRTFQQWFEEYPTLFVVTVEDGTLVATATDAWNRRRKPRPRPVRRASCFSPSQ